MSYRRGLAASPCKKIGIPSQLHRDGRDADQEFLHSEILFRRFYAESKKEVWIDDKRLSASIWPIHNDSCTRSKYGIDHNDALFNKDAVDSSDHFSDWGVLSIRIFYLGEFEKDLTEKDKKRIYTAIAQHDPEECIFTHTEIHVLINGEKVTESRPKSVKALLRDILITNCKVEKEPNI